MCLTTTIRDTRLVYDKLKKRSVNGEVMVYKILNRYMSPPFRSGYQYKQGENVSNSSVEPFVKKCKNSSTREWNSMHVKRGLHVLISRQQAREYKKRNDFRGKFYKIVKFRAKLSELIGAKDNHAVFLKLYLSYYS